MATRQIEIAQRAPNGQFQQIPGSPYQLEAQKLVRIGSAQPPQGDLYIKANPKEIEPLHLLLRVAYQQSSGNQQPLAYELLNVSSQPVTLYRPTTTDIEKRQKIVAPNDSAELLGDYDYVEFGKNVESNKNVESGKANFLLTYQTCEWLNIEVSTAQKDTRSGQTVNSKVSFIKLKSGEEARVIVTFKRYEQMSNISTDAELDFEAEIRGLDHCYGRWHRVRRTEKFSDAYGGEVEFRLVSIAECSAPSKTQRVHFVVTLLDNGKRLAVARGVEIEFAPSGSMALEFTSPDLVRR